MVIGAFTMAIVCKKTPCRCLRFTASAIIDDDPTILLPMGDPRRVW
jgi:hypothetical protein